MKSARVVYVLVLAAVSHPVLAREWRDATGKYSVQADLVASSDEQVVLKREDGKLVTIERKQLSEDDRKFLESRDATAPEHHGDMQTWTLKNGMKVVGRVVAFGRKDVVIQRRRGKVYVNDRHFENLPEVYQKMIPQIVAHFENIEVPDKEAFMHWVVKQGGKARTFVCDGVMLELENGDEYGVPFFFFSNDDLKILQPGWEQWLASHDDMVKRQQEDFLLRAQAAAYQRDRKANQQIASMQLALSAVDAGVTDLWEVQLLPRPGVRARPIVVVVPARNSGQAMAAALSRNPGYVAGPARKLN